MIVNLVPGAHIETVHDRLTLALSGLANGRNGNAGERWEAYVNWVNDTVVGLRGLLTPGTIEGLFLTPVYWRLVETSYIESPHIGRVVDREVADRHQAVQAAVGWLENRFNARTHARFVVADTSFFIHGDKLEDADFRPVARVRERPIHLFVPMVVLDELDRLKDSGKQRARWRAAYTLAVLERVVMMPGEPAELQAEDYSALDSGGIPRGRVMVEVVQDPPGHRRLPLEDDELIDRSVALQALCGEPVTFVTFDTGQAMRARTAGLQVTRLQHPVESEPEPV